MMRIVCGAISALMIASCGSVQSDATPKAQSVTPIASGLRADAIAGRTAILEWSEALGALDEKSAASLDDGTPVAMSLRRILVQPASLDANQTAPASWLGNPGVWSSVRVSGAQDVTGGTPLVFVEMPDHAGGKSLIVNGRQLKINWLPRPFELPRFSQSAEVDPWLPLMSLVEGESRRSFLLEMIASEARSPLTRWRYRLITDGLNPDAPGVAAFADSAVEAIATANENRWQVALAKVWSADPDTQRRLKQRLCGFIDFGGVRMVPAWSTDSASLDSVVAELLEPGKSAVDIKSIAERWMNEGPRVVTWVADVGGVLDSSRYPVAICGIANLDDRTVIGYGMRNDVRSSPDLQPIRPWSIIDVAIPLAPIENEDGEKSYPTSVLIHAGRESVERPVLSVRRPLVPPQLELDSNFYPDWSLDTWYSGRDFAVRAEWLTKGSLYKGVDGGRHWELLITCERVPNIGSEENESVRIFTGPPERPSRVLCVRPDGTVRDEQAPAELADSGVTQVVRTPSRWSFKIRIPQSDIEPDGTLRLGIMRTDAALRRTSWPAPSFPWQTSPPRAALDTKAWK